ncbi:50S ribosomal protein L31 [Erythrobacter sp. NAP1]|nr:50S ribosomal protein L31 [Erythrobacter sp. NAP1]
MVALSSPIRASILGDIPFALLRGTCGLAVALAKSSAPMGAFEGYPACLVDLA